MLNKQQIAGLRLLERDHEPGGYPPITMRDVSALLDIAEAVNNATQGMLSLYPEANDRATYLYFNGGGDVPVGQQVAVLPLAGEVGK